MTASLNTALVVAPVKTPADFRRVVMLDDSGQWFEAWLVLRRVLATPIFAGREAWPCRSGNRAVSHGRRSKMPRRRGSGKRETAGINIRLAPETEVFYKRCANESLASLSQILRDTLIQGSVVENAAGIDARLLRMIDAAVNATDKVVQQRSMHLMLERVLPERHAILVKLSNRKTCRSSTVPGNSRVAAFKGCGPVPPNPAEPTRRTAADARPIRQAPRICIVVLHLG